MVLSVLTCVNELGDIVKQTIHLTGIEAGNLMFKEWVDTIAALDEKYINYRSYTSMNAKIRYGENEFFFWEINHIDCRDLTVKFN